MAEVVIVGGGISGLTAAYRLTQDQAYINGQIKITLLESTSCLGGALCSQAQEDFVIEHGSDSFITNKPWAKELCAELGLSESLMETNESNRRTLIAHGGKLVAVPDGFRMIAPTRFWPFFNSDLLSFAGKCRTLLEPFISNTGGADDESVASFVGRRFGKELLQRVAQPMVGGIYTGDVETLSAQATLPTFKDLESRYGSVIRGLNHEEKSAPVSGARYAIFNTLSGGTGELIAALAKKLPQTSVRLNTAVLAIDAGAERKWSVECADGTALSADAVIIATAASMAGLFLQKLDPALSLLLKTMHNSSSVVINFLFHREDLGVDLPGFGFVVPVSEGRKIIAVSAISAKFKHRAPDNMIMLRVFMGGSVHTDLNHLDENDLKHMALSEMNVYLKIKAKPIKTWFKRWPASMPQYQVGHLVLIGKIAAAMDKYPHLALCGNSYDGVGIPDCIHSAEKAAARALSCLRDRAN